MPSEKQRLFIQSPVEDVLYGGARGGGKSDGLLGDFLSHARRYGENANGILFRRTYDELEELLDRAIWLYGQLGGSYEVQPKRFTINGARLRMRYLDRDEDARHYQGKEYTWIGADEIANFPSPKPLDFIWGSARSVHGIPIRRRSTANPGGPGHVWVKKRYIDHPPFVPFNYQPLESRPDLVIRTLFIPARLEDNPALLQNDPGYEARLAAAGGQKEFEAWRWGDWNAIQGRFFEVFRRDTHIVSPDAMGIEPWHRRWVAVDWGWEHPCAIGFFAWTGQRYFLTRTVLVPHTEIERIALLIVTNILTHRESPDDYDAIYLSRDAFGEKQDENTLALRMEKECRRFGLPSPSRAVQDRVNGWRATADAMRRGLLMFSSECSDILWELLETAIHDPDHPEDLLKFDATRDAPGDDLLDMLRYGLMTRLQSVREPHEEQLRKAISEHTISDEGEDVYRLPTDYNVVAMRAKMYEQKIKERSLYRRARPRFY